MVVVVLVCASLMGRLAGDKSSPATGSPTPLTGSPTPLARPSPIAVAAPAKIPTLTATPQYDPPPPAYQPPTGTPPKDVLANGWDGYDANELAHSARRSSGTYYVATASKRDFYAAFESEGAWRLLHLQNKGWKKLGEAVVTQKKGWPNGRELDRMGAGQIPEKVWTALRKCPGIPFYPVME